MKNNRFLSYAVIILLLVVIGQRCLAVSDEDTKLIEEFDNIVKDWESTWGFYSDQIARGKDQKFDQLLAIIQKFSPDIDKTLFIMGVSKEEREKADFDLKKFVPPAHSPLAYLALFYAPKDGTGLKVDESKIIETLKVMLALFPNDEAKAQALRLVPDSSEMDKLKKTCDVPSRKNACNPSCPLIFYLIKYQTTRFIQTLFESFSDKEQRGQIIASPLVTQRVEIKDFGIKSETIKKDEEITEEVPDETDKSKTKTVTKTVRVKYITRTKKWTAAYYYYSPLYFAAISSGRGVQPLLEVMIEKDRDNACTDRFVIEYYEEESVETLKEVDRISSVHKPLENHLKKNKTADLSLINAIVDDVGQFFVQGPLGENIDAILSYNVLFHDFFPIDQVWEMFLCYGDHARNSYEKSKPCHYEQKNPGACTYCENTAKDFLKKAALRSCRVCLAFLKHTPQPKRNEAIIIKGMLRRILMVTWNEKSYGYVKKSAVLEQHEAKELVETLLSLLSDDAARDRAITEQGYPAKTTALHWAGFIATEEKNDFFLKNFIAQVSDKTALDNAMKTVDGRGQTVVNYYPQAQQLFEEKHGLGITLTKLDESLKVLKEKLQSLSTGLEGLKKGLEKPAGVH